MTTLSWKNKEGIDLHAVDWPVNHPQAVIALVHGQGEHSGRYEQFAQWYARHDIAVMAFDQQGHGKSGGVRGHVRNLDAYLDDIGLLLEKTASRYPGVPVFLYGHSMGGGEVLCYVLRRTPVIAGAIAASPLIRLAFEAPALKVAAGRLLRKIMPALTLPTGLAAHLISRDPEVVKAYQADPLVHGKVSAAGGITLLDMSEWLDSFSGVVTIPLLVMHGSADKITSAAASRAFVSRIAGEVSWQEWPGLWHETHHEPEKEKVFEYTLAWMKRLL